jgi:hypothetical protein
MIGKRIAAAAGAAALTGALLSGTATAQAAPAAGGRHCVYMADTGSTTCYPTFTALTAALTGGKVTDAPAQPDAVSAGVLSANAIGSPVHAVLYQDTNNTGNSFVLASQAGCGSYHWVNLTDFNNKTSAAWVENSCGIRIWDGSNLTSNLAGYYELSAPGGNVPLWINDKASSVEFW